MGTLTLNCCGKWGPEITGDLDLMKRAHFQPFALGGTDKHSETDNPKYWTINSLMQLNGAQAPSVSEPQNVDVPPLTSGHTFIDILKIDIEGEEFDALTSFLRVHANEDVLPVGQLQLEIHASDGREKFESFSRWWATLEAAGLRPFWTEPNLVYVNIVRGSAPGLSEVSCF